MDEPAVGRTRSSLRNDLQLIALVLGIAAWDASVVFVVQIAEKPVAVDWLARLGHLFLGGLLCVGPGVLAVRLLSPGYPATLRACVRTFAAFVLGSAIGHACAGRWIYFAQMDDSSTMLPRVAWSLLIYVLGAASIIGAMYWLRRGSAIRQELHQTRLGLLALQADRAEAELMRLRTQIEPHFLFNTVATVVQLVRSDPVAARRTLARLIEYMSASRAHMRREETTLAEELRLTEGYLEIQRLRMESRLQLRHRRRPGAARQPGPSCRPADPGRERDQARAGTAQARRHAAHRGASRGGLAGRQRGRRRHRLANDQRPRLGPRQRACQDARPLRRRRLAAPGQRRRGRNDGDAAPASPVPRPQRRRHERSPTGGRLARLAIGHRPAPRSCRDRRRTRACRVRRGA